MADQDKRELLRSMLNGLINDKPEEATMDLHNYLTSKMRDLAGLAPEADVEPEVTTAADADLTDGEPTGTDDTTTE
jgi:hypothetical protein